MTREEAIKILKTIKMLMCRPDGTPISDGCEAIDMAIEALQFADKSPRTVKLTEDIVITLDEEAYEIGYTHGQMADRPKGEWIDAKGNPTNALYSVYCSECGGWSEYRTNYCGDCGCYMGGEDNAK